MRGENWTRFVGEFAVTLAIGAGFITAGLAWAVAESGLEPRGLQQPDFQQRGLQQPDLQQPDLQRRDLQRRDLTRRDLRQRDARRGDLRRRDEVWAPIAYAPCPMACSEAKIWLVDGYNVLHAGVLGGRDRSGWWTGSRRRELIERVAGFTGTAEIWIVFDGPDDPAAGPEPPGLHCVFAASADDWLIDRVRSAEDPTQIAVVTADRQIAGRARGRGAQVISPRDFLARCPV